MGTISEHLVLPADQTVVVQQHRGTQTVHTAAHCAAITAHAGTVQRTVDRVPADQLCTVCSTRTASESRSTLDWVLDTVEGAVRRIDRDAVTGGAAIGDIREVARLRQQVADVAEVTVHPPVVARAGQIGAFLALFHSELTTSVLR